MKHPVLETIDNFQLNDPTTLHKRISLMGLDEWDALISYLENGYVQSPELYPASSWNFQPLNFCFPTLSSTHIERITSHLLISEHTYIDDPFYDFATLCSIDPEVSILLQNYYSSQKSSMARSFSKNMADYAMSIEKDVSRNQVENIIRFYLSAKDLIQDGRLIPYKRLSVPSSFHNLTEKLKTTYVSNLEVQHRFPYLGLFLGMEPALLDENFSVKSINKELTKVFGAQLFSTKDSARLYFRLLTLLPYQILNRVTPKKYQSKSSSIYLEHLREFKDDYEQHIVQSKKYRNTITNAVSDGIPMLGNMLWQLTGDSQGLSTDFFTSDMAFYFRFISDAIFSANKQLDTNSQISLPSDFNLLGMDIPLLVDIPPERVLEIAEKEKGAYETFRCSLNEKMLDISAPTGSIERIIEVQKVRRSISKDVATMSLAHQQLQQDYRRRFSTSLGIGSFSILVGGLSTLGQNLDAISVASGVIAGTGLISSIKDFSKDWLEYKKNLDALRKNENYFVWKLTKGRKTFRE